MMDKRILICMAVLATTPVHADSGNLSVEFRESAPKDSFTIYNTGECELNEILTIDLTNSKGKLIFDTSNSGAGVEVFQPFKVVKGSEYLSDEPNITDGDKVAKLNISGLKPGGKIIFTIDVDDTLRDSSLGQIRVSGTEFSGSTIMTSPKASAIGMFEADYIATINTGPCPIT